jgi:hypothetical protein
MWSKMGTSVDISLDNLTPYSKGQKSQPVNNLPLNAMMQPGAASFQSPAIRQPAMMMSPTAINTNLQRLASPPMSPTGANMFLPNFNRK